MLAFVGVHNIVLVAVMTIFSLFGAIFGMSEETIAFTIIFVPLAISMGYDSIVGVSLCFIAAALGFAGAFLNPFTIGVAQGLSHIPLFSGLEYRIVMWLIINFFGFAFILRYAAKIKKDPTKSPVYEDDAYWRSRNETTNVKIEKIKPAAAWFAFAIISVALIIFSVFIPKSSIAIGNSLITAPIIPAGNIVFYCNGSFNVAAIGAIFYFNPAHFYYRIPCYWRNGARLVH